jgi:hypothetical protein
VTGEFKPPATAGALRARPLSVLARPWSERDFVHSRYEHMLDALSDESRYRVVPLRELSSAPRDRVTVSLRHDVEERFRSALQMAELEARHGLRSTYFVLHTAPYYARMGTNPPARREALVPGLQRLQELGHEVGLHNDLVTLQCVHRVEPREYLARELDWLRGHGIDVRGTSSHGSYWTHRLRYHNNYFWTDFEDEVHENFENNEVIQAGGHRCVLSKGSLAEFGLEYEAYHLGEDRYFSDARFDERGRRFHTDSIDLGELRPGDRAIVLTHPDYWDPSVPRKALRTVLWSARKVVAGERRWRLP